MTVPIGGIPVPIIQPGTGKIAADLVPVDDLAALVADQVATDHDLVSADQLASELSGYGPGGTAGNIGFALGDSRYATLSTTAATVIAQSLAYDPAVSDNAGKFRWFTSQEHVARGLGWVIFNDPRVADPGGDAGVTWNNCKAALGASGGTIWVPPGTFTGATRPILGSKIVCRGAGKDVSILSFTAGGFTWSTSVTAAHFEHVGLQAAGGHLFEPTGSTSGLDNGSIRHCSLVARTSYSIWYQVNNGSFDEITVEKTWLSASATATLPAWYVVNGAGAANAFRFRDIRANGAGNPNRPFFWIESNASGTYAYDGSFENVVGEQNVGGLIWLFGAHNANLRNCVDWDATVPYTGDIIRISRNGTTPPQSRHCTVQSCGRRSSTLAAGVYDVNIVPGQAVLCTAINNNIANLSGQSVTTQYAPDTVVMGESKDVAGAAVRGAGSFPGGITLANGQRITSGTGNPNGTVTGSVGDKFYRTDGTAGAVEYVKASGTATNTGWLATPSAGPPPIGRVTGKRLLLSGLPRAMALTQTTLAKDVWRFMPLSAQEAIPLVNLAVLVNVVASGGTAAMIFALFNVDSYFRPGTLNTDFSTYGSVDLTVVGEKTLALTGGFTIPQGDWYIGCAWTGSASVNPSMQLLTGVHPEVMGDTAVANASAYSQSVSGGSAPSPAVPAGAAAQGVAVWGVRG